MTILNELQWHLEPVYTVFNSAHLYFCRHQKNSRIINWICQGQGSELQGPNLFEPPDLESDLLDYSLEEDIEPITPGPANE